MEGDLHVVAIEIHLNLSRADQFIDQLRVMDDGVISTERRIFILQCMQTMWTSRDDSFWFDFI